MPPFTDTASRADLIADFMASHPMAVPPPAPAPAPDAPDAPPEAGDQADQDVAAALDAAENALEQAMTAVKRAQTAQAADDDGEPDGDDTPPPAVTAAASEPDTGTDDDGGISANATCARPDCGHSAGLHGNTDTGEYTGACSFAGCQCEAFSGASTSQTDDDTTDDSNGPDGLPQPDSSEFAAEAVQVEAAPNQPPDVEPSAPLGARFAGILIIEGQPTGDGRQIAIDALTWRDPPLPLMGLATATHDPNGFDLNDPSVMCGIIDTLTKAPGDDGTQLVNFAGNFLANDDGQYFADLVAQLGRMGVSADVAAEATDIEVTDVDDIGMPVAMAETLTAGRVMGGTLCPFPAFEGCCVWLDQGDGVIPEPAAIPESTETAPAPPASVLAGGQLVHLMTYEACGECDLGLEVVTASGAPVAPPAEWFADPGFEPGDGALQPILTRDGRDEGRYACPLTVTDDGRVYGHIAPWGVCHTGVQGQCVVAPPSGANYAHFRRGQVITADGARVRVGNLTCGAGHASRTAGAVDAMAHYDNTAMQVAHVNIGEDEYGIWVAGAVAPGATPAQIATLRASSISGDWRKLGGQLELVSALAVNNPGFPVSVVASGGPVSLTAAGVQTMALLKQPAADAPAAPAAADPRLFERALAPLVQTAREHTRARMAAIRG